MVYKRSGINASVWTVSMYKVMFPTGSLESKMLAGRPALSHDLMVFDRHLVKQTQDSRSHTLGRRTNSLIVFGPW